jgi:hypothetical protein
MQAAGGSVVPASIKVYNLINVRCGATGTDEHVSGPGALPTAFSGAPRLGRPPGLNGSRFSPVPGAVRPRLGPVAGSVQFQNTRVEYLSLLERGTHRPVQAVLQVEIALPLHDVREEITVERRVLGEQGLQIELLLGGDELVKAYRAWGNVRPLPGAFPAVVGIRPPVADALEDHTESLPGECAWAQQWRGSGGFGKDGAWRLSWLFTRITDY